MFRKNYKQEIRGNPGDCYIACILYVLKKKYDLETNVATQKDIFTKGILKSKATFFMGSLNYTPQGWSRFAPFGFDYISILAVVYLPTFSQFILAELAGLEPLYHYNSRLSVHTERIRSETNETV